MHRSFDEYNRLQSRRQFLKTSGVGLGATALASLLSRNDAPLHGTDHPPRAKRVIFLFMAGAPSQIDLFDYKPNLEKLFKKPLPKSISQGQRVTAMTNGKTQLVMPSMFKFHRQGQNGVHWSELLPHLSALADDVCVIKSLNINAINHDPAKTFFCTGAEIPGKASMGAWLSYGLGSMNRDLPDFVVLTSAYWTGGTRNVQGLYSRLWGSGFLPSRHQGAAFQAAGDPVLFLSNPKGVDADVRRRMLDTVRKVNRKHHAEIGDPEIETTISQQEMAFRMQSSVPELTDLSAEPKNIMAMYGPEVEKTGSFARNCLLARRMVERDVRFIQIFHRGWDHHSILPKQLRGQCFDVDQPAAALIMDLKQRGLLDDTLIVFAGEFGRTVYGQGKLKRDDYGRDHHPRCFAGWLAGGGIKGGISYGETDDFSYNIAKDPVHVRDLHATILHQLGIDHERLTFPFQGLDHRLTGVEPARVVRGILV
ncbi:MAG: sulfatase [Planctomycetes bacterium]|nr:sulfatase [Planctomycetota bacterium]